MKCMNCPECGEEIVFSYIVPFRSFRITEKAILRDDAWAPEYDNPYLEFFCSNDKEHDIDVPEIVEWTEGITEEFYLHTFPNL